MVQAGSVEASAGTKQQAGPSQARPTELEDWLNRAIYHQLSRRIALAFQHTPISPNMVSVSSFVAIVAAAFCYTSIQTPAGIAAGLFFHLLWHVLDGADGDLARLTGKISPFGEMIDGICDYAGHVILYTALAFSVGGWVLPVTAAAAASRILQSNHIESVRRTYLWRGYGVPWLRQSKEKVAGRPGPAGRVLGRIADLYLWLAAMLIPASGEADAMAERLQRAPATRDEAQTISRTVGRKALAFQFWLGSNRRTLLLGLSMALGSPGWFFLLEATGLNLLLVASVMRQRRVNHELAQALAAIRPH